MRRVLRLLLAGVAVLLLLAVVAGTGVGVWSARRPLPETDGRIALEALGGTVDVYRDAFGVPHLYADTAHDLFLAQGYVHAQDRFWEMDVRRHTTAGRLSELFGESQVDTDAFIRTMGWRRVAEQEWALLTDDTRQLFRDYAEGVNAYLDGRPPGEISLEYAVLDLQHPGYEPEPWTPLDSLAWLKAMAWDLRGNSEDEIERVELTSALPVERIDELWPPFPFDLREPIVPEATGATVGEPELLPPQEDDATALAEPGGRVPSADSAAGHELTRVRPMLARLSRGLAGLPPMIGPAGPGVGSNAFAVSGEHTATGLPLLANDPHLGPALPSIWYQMALHCRAVSDACPYTVTGVTFSGMPGVIIGHNQRIAWGFTNLGPDVADLVLERVTGDGYEHRGGTLPLEQHEETIRVAGGDDVTITVRETGHGPLLSDVSESFAAVGADAPAAAGEPGLAVALRWTALRPGRTADALPALNRARDWDEFRAAAALFEVPAQNLVYADVDGNIGYQAPGWIPVRAPGDDGRWPVPGWTGEHDWRGRVAFEDLPSVLNPDEGVIVTANQPVVGEDAGPFFSLDHAYGWRSQRLRDLLAGARGRLDPGDLVRMQMDAHNGIAETLVPLLAAVEVSPQVAGTQDLLRDWDLRQTADSAAGAYFAGVWRHLLLRTFGDELPADAAIDGGERWLEVVRVLAADPEAEWWDDVRTARREGRDDMLRAALEDAHADLSERLGDDPRQWRWGDLHVLALRHPTLGSSGVAPVERLFNRAAVGAGGGDGIVKATGWDPRAGYDVDWVPSMRMVVDLADLDASQWINLTGASGHAFSRHYTDQVDRWAQGRTIPMRWSPEAVRAAATGHLLLAPGNS